jgi:hypothetical protein
MRLFLLYEKSRHLFQFYQIFCRDYPLKKERLIVPMYYGLENI